MNRCRGCGCVFSSVQAFDKHRIGLHAYTYSEGINMEPMREDGRRCLSVEEMEMPLGDSGVPQFRLNASGRWELSADADRARRAFGRMPERQVAA